MPPLVGQPAPDFTLVNQDRLRVTFSAVEGNRLLVFMPFAFTSTCEGELCQIRDNLAGLEALGARVLVVTCDTFYTNKAWAVANGFGFDILSDFWPHGAVARAYGAFDEEFGYARRTSFVIDRSGIIRDIIASAELDTERPFSAYPKALSGL